MEDNPDRFYHYREIETVRQSILEEKYSTIMRQVEVTYLFGASGTGKTRGIFRAPQSGKAFAVSLTMAEKMASALIPTVVRRCWSLKNFHSQIPISAMLNYLDIYPIMLPARYNDRVACYTKVYITSNIPLRHSIRRSSVTSWKHGMRSSGVSTM